MDFLTKTGLKIGRWPKFIFYIYIRYSIWRKNSTPLDNALNLIFWVP